MPSNMTKTSTSSPILIALAWLIVLIPAVWGFSYTAQSAIKIFDRAPTVTPSK